MQPPGKDGTEEDREWLNLPGATEAEEEDFYLLPENHKAWELFCACSTQWRVGMAGPTGLDYPAVESVMRMLYVKQKHQKDRHGLSFNPGPHCGILRLGKSGYWKIYCWEC